MNLDTLGVIEAEGSDACAFLHGQLTQDVVLLPVGQIRLAAYCSPKGRMLVSFVLLKAAPDRVLLLCPREALPAALKRLSLFVLRAKVRLSDASARFQCLGWLGDVLPGAQPGADGPWSASACEGGTRLVLYPADGQARGLWLAPADVARPLPLGQAPALSADLWAWAEVRSGVAPIGTALADALVPQMLNYESVGAVNFKKGCYPGQEVVARSQFRGTLKRRAFLARCDAPLSSGDAVYSTQDPEQPCGLVALAAAAPQGGYEAIVSLQLAAYETGGLRLRDAQGPELRCSAPPYPLLADV
ncbi:MAG: folate-binding protein YgfZ [Rhodoferax sp.]|nr:folate-binding protein YgfZ [Rhodoferax sp.]